MAPRPLVSIRTFVAFLTLACLFLLAAPSEAQQVQVLTSDPPSAEQGTVNLNVTIGGKGFKKGATATFVLTGTDDPDGITVNSTTFENATTLVANISVADTATVSKFDIKVHSDGRIGKGTELFSVLTKGSSKQYTDVPAVSVLESQNTFTNTPFRIHDDGNGAYLGYSVKPDGKRADYLLSQVYSATGDWVVDSQFARTAPRNVYLDLRDGFGPIGQVELLLPARVLVRCLLTDDPNTSADESTWSDGGLLAMSASLPKKTNCRLGVEFTYQRVTYSLLLGPYHSGDSTWVTCTGFSSDGTSCTSWQIEAGTYDPVFNPNGNPGTRAWLIFHDSHGDQKVGEYNVSFRIQVARQ